MAGSAPTFTKAEESVFKPQCRRWRDFSKRIQTSVPHRLVQQKRCQISIQAFKFASFIAAHDISNTVGATGCLSRKKPDSLILIPDYSRGVGVEIEKAYIPLSVVPGLWFRQFTNDIKLTNLQTCRHFRTIASKAKPDTCRRE
jgi:hypothetical protein